MSGTATPTGTPISITDLATRVGAVVGSNITAESVRASAAEAANAAAIASEATTARNATNLNGGTVPAAVLSGATVTGAVVTPTGATTASTLAAVASQQGVILDAFKMAGDADDTAAMVRAVAAGAPILLGPKTYVINNYNMAGTPASFVLIGVQGKSVIQRTDGSGGSNFFTISAASVVIDGVIFDMNKAALPTANQWGVRMAAGGQTVSVRRSVFKNNGGNNGTGLVLQATSVSDGGSFNISDNEIFGNIAQVGAALYVATASHGVISRNFVHDNTGTGVSVSVNGTATTTNYLTDVTISKNRVIRNGGTGIGVGGYSVPFTYPTALPPATNVLVDANIMVDNANYAIAAQGDDISVTNNKIGQSSPSVTVYGGITGPHRYSTISGNTIKLSGVPWGLDAGGAIQATVENNTITMDQGAALNAGGSINNVVKGNHLILSGTAKGVTIAATESGGGNVVMPVVTSGVAVTDNVIDLSGTLTTGIYLVDNPGGYPGATPCTVSRNHFNASNGAAPLQDIVWYGSVSSLKIDGNLHNGSNKQFADPPANGDVQFDLVYLGGTISGSTATFNVRSIAPSIVTTYAAGGSILYVMPSAGGSGYTAATTLSASGTGGGSGWVGTPMIIGGVIVGVRTSAFGSGYSGTITVTATDSGGGSGATFTVGNTPKIPVGSRITYMGNTNYLLQHSGGFITLVSPPFVMTPGTGLQLEALSNNSWVVTALGSTAVVTTATLTTIGANAASLGAEAIVTDATSPTYGGVLTGGGSTRVRVICDGTNWRTY